MAAGSFRLGIDARGAAAEAPAANAATRVAGLTLLGRHLRLAARLGCAAVDVHVASAAERDEILHLVAADPPPSGVSVAVAEWAVAADSPRDDADNAEVPVQLRAIYTRDGLAAAAASGRPPEPLARVELLSDVGPAAARLRRSLRKSIAHDGVVAWFVMRPLSELLARALVDTRVTPNQVTLLALAFGLVAGWQASLGGYSHTVAAGILVWAGAVVDCVDGDLARMRLQSSRLGQWLDTLADDVTTCALVVGLGMGLHRDGADRGWLVLAVAAALVFALAEAKSYADLHRLGLPIDTAAYPWFYGDPSRGRTGRRGFVAFSFYVIGFLFKRDAFITVVALFLLLDLRRVVVVGLAAGNAVLAGLLIVHVIVMAARARRQSISRTVP